MSSTQSPDYQKPPQMPLERKASTKHFRMPAGVLARDRPLGGRHACSWEAVAEQLPDLPKPKTAMQARAMATIVCDVALEAQGRDRRTSYSRSQKWYAAQSPWMDSLDYGYESVVTSVDALLEVGILVDGQKADTKSGATGWQSSFAAGPALRTFTIPESTIVVCPRLLIRLRNRETKEQIMLPDTDALRRMSRWMERANEARASFDVVLDAGERRGYLLDFKGVRDGKEVTHTIDTRMIHSYRSFSGNLQLGGRMYGDGMQGVPAHLRAGVILCGEKVAEPDFAALHARLLYAHAGIILPDSYDPYTDVAWGEEMDPKTRRDRLKLGFLILVNASHSVIATIAAMLMREDGRIGIPEKPDWNSARAMVRAIEKAHAPVKHMLGADMGVRFQRIDSDMAVKVIDRLVLKEGIPALHIFDSFMIPERQEGHVRGVMNDVLGDTLRGISASMKSRSKTTGSSKFVPHTRLGLPSPSRPTHRFAGDSSNPYHDPSPRRPRSKAKGPVSTPPVPSFKPLFMVKPKVSPMPESTT